MTKLSPRAESALETLREKHMSYTIAKATVESELKRELQARLSVIRNERDMALRLASEVGVPKTQLGRAIGTSNYRTVQEILATLENVVQATDSDSKGTVQVEKLGSDQYRIIVAGIGEPPVAGSAVVNGNLDYVEGDAFVVPQVYRNGFADQIANEIARLG